MYDEAFENGVRFETFLESVDANRDLWHALAGRARVDPDLATRVQAAPGRWRLLAIAEDWCGDAVNILPVAWRLAEAAQSLDLRIVGRDAHPELMDRHLTNGGRAIPVVVLIDEAGACRGWWGPRPSALQDWFETEGRELPKPDRYRELRRRYARDRGRSIALELVELIEHGASPRAAPASDAVRPCARSRAA